MRKGQVVDWLKLRHDNEVVEIQVPPSLLAFLRKWSKDGKHKIDDVALSLFNQGLIAMLALSEFDPELIAQVYPILDDICANAPDNTHMVEITLVRETRARVQDVN